MKVVFQQYINQTNIKREINKIDPKVYDDSACIVVRL